MKTSEIETFKIETNEKKNIKGHDIGLVIQLVNLYIDFL